MIEEKPIRKFCRGLKAMGKEAGKTYAGGAALLGIGYSIAPYIIPHALWVASDFCEGLFDFKARSNDPEVSALEALSGVAGAFTGAALAITGIDESMEMYKESPYFLAIPIATNLASLSYFIVTGAMRRGK